jgi:hypothetical protein
MGHVEPSVATSVPGAVRGVNDLTGYNPAQRYVATRSTPRGRSPKPAGLGRVLTDGERALGATAKSAFISLGDLAIMA